MSQELETAMLDLARYHQQWAWLYTRHAHRLGRIMTPKERKAYDVHNRGARTAYRAWRELSRVRAVLTQRREVTRVQVGACQAAGFGHAAAGWMARAAEVGRIREAVEG